MTITVYGAFRTDTTMSDNLATYATTGGTFSITSYSELTFEEGADPDIIDGDSVTNESPNDATQTYLGNAIAWDWTVTVTDGVNNYEVGMLDYDANSDGDFDYTGGDTGEQGYFIVFIGDIPPLNTTLTFGAITDNGPSIDVDTTVPCFVSGTLIETPDGPRVIDTLKVGDLVQTMDNGAQEIRWIGRRTLDIRDLLLKPKLHPIRISAGSLGVGLPLRDLCVSPQHRMLARSPIVARMFDVDEALVPANKLVGIPGIYVDNVSAPVTYLHILFDQHEIVFAEGAPSESLYTGAQALTSIGEEAREEVLTLFPELKCHDHAPVSARHIPEKGKQVKTLVSRLIKNQKPVFATL